MNTAILRLRLARTSRSSWIMGLIALVAVLLFGRAVYLQLLNADFLQGQGIERFQREVEVPAHRGVIMDRNGETLAMSSPVDSVWGNPSVLNEQLDKLPMLARALEIDPRELVQKVQSRSQREFMYLRRGLEPDVAKAVLDLGVQGVSLQREYRRFYPAGEVTSHLLGFTNIDDEGQEGVELVYNSWLNGVPGSNRVIRDRYGRIVESVEQLREPQPGQPLVLSIDRRIQYLAYRALKAAVLEHHAAAAAAVVIDIPTGEILAMVDQPASNPNNRSEINSNSLRNRAVIDVYEPGSTMKPFAVAMALESGHFTPDTPVNTSPGFWAVGGHTVRDVHNYGFIDVTRVISKSSNVGTAKIVLSFPPERLWSVYRALGFGSTTGIGFPGEQPGFLGHYSKWGSFEYATRSFGYGVSVTTLQLAHAYATLAGGGVRRPLSLLRRETAPEGERVFSESVTRKMMVMLELATAKEGTGFSANVQGYRVAGKTGTVRKFLPGGGYSSNRYLSLFAGVVPVSKPRLAMAIVVDDAKGGVYYGGQVAAPVFSRVMAGALRILNVTPDATAEPPRDSHQTRPKA